MKHFLLIICFSLVLFSLNGTGQTSNLILDSEHGENFLLYLNGIPQNEEPENRIEITRLDRPSYKVKITVVTIYRAITFSKTIYLKPDHEVTYLIKRSAEGKYYMDKVNDVSLEWQTYMDEDYDDDYYPPTPPPPPTVDYLPGYNGPVGCPVPMSPEGFREAKTSVDEKTFEDSKLTMAKQIISMNCLLSRQVKELMLLLTFESSRLDLAKFAFNHTYDLGNYYLVNDAFTFESSIKELDDFIHERH